MRRSLILLGAIVGGLAVAVAAFLVLFPPADSDTPPTGTPPIRPTGQGAIVFKDLSEGEELQSPSLDLRAPPADEGDFLLAILLAPGVQAEREGRKMIPPDGWNYIQGELHATWWWRIAQPGDAGTTWTWAGEEQGRLFNWNGFIYVYEGVDPSDPIAGFDMVRACSEDADPVCDRGPGTPGQLVTAPVDAPDGALAVVWYTAHSRRNNQISLPPGFTVRSNSSVMGSAGAVTIGGDRPLDGSSAVGQLAAGTTVSDYVHGLAGVVVLRPAA